MITKDGLDLAIATQTARHNLGELDVTLTIESFLEIVRLARLAEGVPLLLATEKGLTPLGKLIDACREMLKDINYTRGLVEGSVGKGAGNRMADALDELLPSMNSPIK